MRSPAGHSSKEETRLWRILTFAVCGTVLSGVLFYPLGSDTSIYQWVALRWLRNGAIPYLGTWENNFPGILPFHLIPIALFGNSEIGFRIFEVFFHTCVTGFLFSLLLEWFSARAAFFSAVCYAAFFLRGGEFYYGQRDVFAAGLFVIALWLFLKSSSYRSTASLFGVGLILGWIILIRPFYIVLPLSIFLVERRAIGRKQWLLFAIAVILPGVAFLFPYVVFARISEPYYSTIVFLSQLYTHVATPTWHELVKKLFLYCGIPILLSAIGFGLLWKTNRASNGEFIPRNISKLYGILITAILVVVIIQQRYLEYHFAIFLVLLTPLAGYFLDKVMSKAGSLSGGRLWQWTVSVVAVLLLAPIIPAILFATDFPLTDTLLMKGFIGSDVRNLRRADDHLIAYLRTPNNRKGICEVCSYDYRLRLRLDRENATRFAEFQAVTVTDKNGHHPDFQQAWRSEFVDAIAKKQTRFVVLNTDASFWNYPPAAIAIRDDFSELRSLLNSGYIQDTVIGPNVIYRVRNDSLQSQ